MFEIFFLHCLVYYQLTMVSSTFLGHARSTVCLYCPNLMLDSLPVRMNRMKNYGLSFEYNLIFYIQPGIKSCGNWCHTLLPEPATAHILNVTSLRCTTNWLSFYGSILFGNQMTKRILAMFRRMIRFVAVADLIWGPSLCEL